MQSFIFLFFVMFSANDLFAQINIVSLSVTHPDSNILFVGVDNRLKVSGIKDYKISSNTSLLYKIYEDEYDIRVSDVGQSIIKLYKSGKLFFSKTFRIETIPLPKVQVGFIKDTIATIEEILENPFLQVVFPNCQYKHLFKIKAFSVIIPVKRDSILDIKSNSNYFSKEQIEMIKTFQLDERLWFLDIYGNCPDCARIKFPSFYVTIKKQP